MGDPQRNPEIKAGRAFTLIEIMLVVIIVGVLVAVVTPRLAGRSEDARRSVAKTDIELTIPTALKMFEFDNGRLPTTQEGLDALLTSPANSKNWKGPYLEKAPLDPWGKAYLYRSPGSHRKDYDLYSLGKDGSENDDDISNW